MSSQALCVSVWGTIATHPKRTVIVRDVFAAAGRDLGKVTAPRIRCEAGADGDLAHLLNETGGNATPTCVDAMIDWPRGTVCVESKLTEPSFGACSQTRVALRPAAGHREGHEDQAGTGVRRHPRPRLRPQDEHARAVPARYVGWRPSAAPVLEPGMGAVSTRGAHARRAKVPVRRTVVSTDAQPGSGPCAGGTPVRATGEGPSACGAAQGVGTPGRARRRASERSCAP